MFLLIGKVFGVFLFSWLTGWSVCSQRPVDNKWVSWVVEAVVGAATLNLLIASAVVFNMPGRSGLLVLIPIFLFRIIRCRTRRDFDLRNLANPFFLIISLVVLSYLAPFFSESTSGLYSRGGGDHSTYLSLSEYFKDHSFWEPIAKSETFPPAPYWETMTYPHTTQKIHSSIQVIEEFSALPVGNQMIASPYMAVFPGLNDETYSAAVAFYVSMAAASVIALLFTLSGGWTGRAWLAFIPLALSNLLLYPAGTQSIPFLFAIAMLNVSLLLAWYLTKKPIVLGGLISYVPAIICGAGMLTIYPFLFCLMCFFYAVYAMHSLNWERVLSYFKLALIVFLGSVLLSHFYIIINFPLVLYGATAVNSLYHPFTLAQIFSTQSGLVDFLSLPADGSVSTFARISSLLVIVSFGLSIYGYMRQQKKELILALAMMVVFIFAGVYFNQKEPSGGGGYQMVRFAVLSHLYLLGLTGLGIVALLRGKRWQASIGIGVIMVFSVLAIYQRKHVVDEIVNIPHAFATEFRDLDSYRIRATVEDIQKSAGIEHNRIVYYFGHGDGTDFAGSTVFMRPLFALNAANLESILQASSGKSLWNKNWLNGAILMYSPVHQNDIVRDRRSGAAIDPVMAGKRLSIWDSAKQNIAAVVGEGWNYPIPFSTSAEDISLRYLRGRTGAVVVWSDRQEIVNLSFTLSADTPGTSLHFRDLQNNSEKRVSVSSWTGDYSQATFYQAKVELFPGANVFEMSPEGKSEATPWLLVFKIEIDN
jgi:hypothetical protein